MLIGLVLVAVGIALLGYVVTARQPRPSASLSGSPETKPLAPSSLTKPRSADVLDLDDLADSAETQILPLRPSLRCEVPLNSWDVEEPPAPEATRTHVAPKVVVAYEDEAEQEEHTSPVPRILITASGDTDRGKQRRANDDSLLVLPDHCLFAVADGMGGYAGGSVASRLAVEAMQQAFEQERFAFDLRSARPIPRRGRELASSIIQAHAAVARRARVSPELSKMGTTLVAARFSPNKQRVYIANVGDSRCYRLRRGSLTQLTADQTMGTVGLRGPHADDLLQAVGVTASLAIDLIVDKPRAGDVYLLCSDGLNKMVPDSRIEKTLAEQPNLEAAVYDLIELANDAGGRDNVTVVLIRVLDRATFDLATTKSWTTPSNVRSSDTCGSDDVTVVGGLTEDQLKALLSESDRANRYS